MRKPSANLVNLERELQDAFRDNLKVMPEEEAKAKLKADLTTYITKLKRNHILPMDYKPEFEIIIAEDKSVNIEFK